MTPAVTPASVATEAGAEATLADFRRLVAEDLAVFALLHHAEPSQEWLTALVAQGGLALGLELHSPAGQTALAAMADAVAALPKVLDQTVLDQFAADYADIYLTHGYRASPHESVWLDEDHLMRQEPMFQVRAYYARHGLTAGNWRVRPDDHLALQLQFLAYLLAPERDEDTLAEAARFLDEHLLRWLPQFAQRIAERCRTGFFAALAPLTAIYCDELRDVLALILAEPRPSPEDIEQRMKPKRVPTPVPVTFVPGQGPTW